MPEIEPGIDRLPAIALVNVPEARHVVARARRAAELELHGLATPGRFHPFDLVQLLHPALDLGRVRRPRLEALDELHLLGEHRLLALELRLALPLAQRPLLLVEIEVARIGGERPAVDLHDLADDAVHELAVMRRHQQRAVVLLEEILQPDQAFEVEMVGGLVEQHAVGPHQQDAGERHAHLPAAGEQADVAVHAFLAEAQAREHLARPGLQRIAIQLLEAPLHLAIALDDGVHVAGLLGIDHRGLEPGHLGGQRTHRPDAIHHLGDRAPARHLADILAEIADRHAGIDRHLAIVGLLLAGDHAEKRRLAGAIGPDKPHLLSLLDAHRRVDEQDLMAVLLADVVETNHEVRLAPFPRSAS